MKKAIVIGASSGIGREMALSLISDGWSVGLGARRTDRLEEIRQLAPERISAEQIDVTASDAPEKLGRLIESVGGMDLLFYAAGIGKVNTQLDPAIELSVVNTNAMGFTRMINAAWQYMAGHSGGHIAAISSIAGIRGLGPSPSYSATKALQNKYIEALEQLSRNRKMGITFTDIRPGFIDTALIAGSHFPMTMPLSYAARKIRRAVDRRKRVAYIDWRWYFVTLLMRLVPRCIWRNLKLAK